MGINMYDRRWKAEREEDEEEQKGQSSYEKRLAGCLNAKEEDLQ